MIVFVLPDYLFADHKLLHDKPPDMMAAHQDGGPLVFRRGNPCLISSRNRSSMLSSSCSIGLVVSENERNVNINLPLKSIKLCV